MSKLVAIGSRIFVVALSAIGAEPIPCETAEEFDSALRRLAVRKNVDLVFISDPQAQSAPDAVAAFRGRSTAALLSLPLVPSETHPSLEQVRHIVEQATGASLI